MSGVNVLLIFSNFTHILTKNMRLSILFTYCDGNTAAAVRDYER